MFRRPRPDQRRKPFSQAGTGGVGEKWSLLVLREVFYGARRFERFQARIGCPRTGAAGHRLGPGRRPRTRYARGYFDQTAQIWGRDATLLATSHQIVYYKE
jgi:hypothetical protein